MAQTVVFIQGGGIGIDQERAVKRVVQALGVPIEWQDFPAGLTAVEQSLPPIGENMLAAVRKAGVALKTKLMHPAGGGGENYNIKFRHDLGLFASVRPIQNFAGIPSRFDQIDILLVREITEDLYTAIEHEVIPGVVQSIKVVTETACMRFFEFCFKLATEQKRKSIHCVHKANILKLADGLFLECFRKVASKYPAIAAKDMIVDNACMQLVSKPQQFEVMVAGNLYGDLLSDLGAGLIGGISATSAISNGQGVKVYEAIHGGPRDVVGADRANPLPLLAPLIHMLHDLGHPPKAQALRAAIEKVLVAGQVRTGDLGGKSSSTEFTDAIIKALGA